MPRVVLLPHGHCPACGRALWRGVGRPICCGVAVTADAPAAVALADPATVAMWPTLPVIWLPPRWLPFGHLVAWVVLRLRLWWRGGDA
jgi:hypothetical protein